MRGIKRVFTILRAFGAKRPELTLTEIAERTRLDLGTTRRLLAALAHEGIVARDPVSRRYRLDLGMLELAAGVVEGDGLRAYAQTAVDTVARETGNTAFFGVHRDGEALCYARAEGASVALLRWWTLGGRIPLHCGAAPRVLLAHLPAADIDRALAKPLAAFTPRSETSLARLRADLGRIRRAGHAFAADDIVLGVAGLAVPVFDRAGRPRGALSIAGLTPQFSPAARRSLLATLRRAAETMRRNV
jgi:DNA-binding IclR family transcriptional regulator